MKRILLTLLTAAIILAAFAQQPDKALAKVSYTFIHLNDTTHRNRLYTENMLLIIGKNASVYTSYDKINQNAIMKKQMGASMTERMGSIDLSLADIGGKMPPPVSLTNYYFFTKENKLFTEEPLFNVYLTAEEAPKINWNITKDTLSFSGVKCQKAFASFKGRNWIAWFAPDLPFQSGPWKLHGLPGLIIEAYDANKEVQFKFAGIEKVNPETTNKDQNSGEKLKKDNPDFLSATDFYSGNEIKLPAYAIRTSKKELDKLKTMMEKDPDGFISAQTGGNGSMAMRTTAIGIPAGNSSFQKMAENNPVEIPEKK